MMQSALQEEGTCAPKHGLVHCVSAWPLHHRHHCCATEAGMWLVHECLLSAEGQGRGIEGFLLCSWWGNGSDPGTAL